jgi:hypothetical protein
MKKILSLVVIAGLLVSSASSFAVADNCEERCKNKDAVINVAGGAIRGCEERDEMCQKNLIACNAHSRDFEKKLKQSEEEKKALQEMLDTSNENSDLYRSTHKTCSSERKTLEEGNEKCQKKLKACQGKVLQTESQENFWFVTALTTFLITTSATITTLEKIAVPYINAPFISMTNKIAVHSFIAVVSVATGIAAALIPNKIFKD